MFAFRKEDESETMISACRERREGGEANSSLDKGGMISVRAISRAARIWFAEAAQPASHCNSLSAKKYQPNGSRVTAE